MERTCFQSPTQKPCDRQTFCVESLYSTGATLLRFRYTLIVMTLFLVTFILLCNLSVDAESNSSDYLSLEFTNQPLSQVLDRLSQITGLHFIYDRDWADAKISAKIIHQDLDSALRRVLNSYNYGILYGTDGNVRIMIYGEKGITSSSPINASPSVEYGHVGSAAIQEDDGATSQDIEENQAELDFVDTSERGQDDDLEENEKSPDDDTETDGDHTETDTEDMNEGDSEEDDRNSLTSETND